MYHLTFVSKLKYSFKYFLFEKFTHVIILLTATLTGLFMMQHHKADWWDNTVDPFTSMITLIIAFSIAILNYYDSWVNCLGRVLTVHYTYDGKYYLSCYHTDLAHEGDIRNWAIQIGSQMCNAGLLKLEPFFDLDGPEIVMITGYSKPVKHYIIYMRLSSLQYDRPTGIISGYSRWQIHHTDKLTSSKETLDFIKIPPSHFILP